MTAVIQNVTLIIIGYEILSGRRQDKHFSKAVELLSQRGMQLGGAQFVSDDRDTIASVLARTFASGDIVFCRSEEHTSELQSLMRISYAVFCLTKKKKNYSQHRT